MSSRARTGDDPSHTGVLVPWANMVVEAELHRVTGIAVTWHYSRLVPQSRTTGLDDRFLTGLLDAVPGALAQLEALPLTRAYMACTSAAFTYPDLAGHARDNSQVQLVSAFDAIIAALACLHATRVALLTPYPDEVTATEAAMLTEAGLLVICATGLGLGDGYGSVTPRQITKLARSVGSAVISKADAVVLSCTGWPTLSLIPELEQDLGRPVVSSNLAIGWHALGKGD
jgi:maleate isomerase